MQIEVPSILSVIPGTARAEHQPRLAMIDLEDYSGVARKVAEHFTEIGQAVPDGYIVRGIFALKQYYAVALFDPANAHAISRPIDPFWHAHILHTEAYVTFCDRVMGEYMHHRPLDHSNAKQVAMIRRLYEYTLEVLPKLFPLVDRQFWPLHVADRELIMYA